jgi:superfamily II DNA or RNA helicase
LTPWDRAKYAKMGLIAEDEPLTSLKRRIWLTKQFEQGKLKKVIATTVWNVGVSFNHLEVLIRADGGGSPINDVQIPGRVSRLNDKKEYGIVHDYIDQFNSSFQNRAKSRKRTYEKHGWTQVMPQESALDSVLAKGAGTKRKC